MTYYSTIQQSHHTHIPPIKGSKFEGYIFHADNQKEANEIIAKIWKMHPKATHVCYANSVGIQIQQDMFGQVMAHSERDYANDDGEPSGTAGRPILQVLQGAQLRNVGCAVVRYYGGTMLGVGGLVKAYTQAAQAVVQTAKIVQTPITRQVTIRVGIADFHQVMSRRAQHGYAFEQQTVGDESVVMITVPWMDYDQIVTYCDRMGRIYVA